MDRMRSRVEQRLGVRWSDLQALTLARSLRRVFSSTTATTRSAFTDGAALAPPGRRAANATVARSIGGSCAARWSKRPSASWPGGAWRLTPPPGSSPRCSTAICAGAGARLRLAELLRTRRKVLACAEVRLQLRAASGAITPA
jgi:hypothetical protein